MGECLPSMHEALGSVPSTPTPAVYRATVLLFIPGCLKGTSDTTYLRSSYKSALEIASLAL